MVIPLDQIYNKMKSSTTLRRTTLLMGIGTMADSFSAQQHSLRNDVITRENLIEGKVVKAFRADFAEYVTVIGGDSQITGTN
jgi:hypothetical protein